MIPLLIHEIPLEFLRGNGGLSVWSFWFYVSGLVCYVLFTGVLLIILSLI